MAANKKMKVVVKPKWAAGAATKKQHAAIRSVMAMKGNVRRSKDRRPYGSIYRTAGQANRKLSTPNPHDTRSAVSMLATLALPASAPT